MSALGLWNWSGRKFRKLLYRCGLTRRWRRNVDTHDQRGRLGLSSFNKINSRVIPWNVAARFGLRQDKIAIGGSEYIIIGHLGHFKLMSHCYAKSTESMTGAVNKEELLFLSRHCKVKALLLSQVWRRTWGIIKSQEIVLQLTPDVYHERAEIWELLAHIEISQIRL